MDDERWRRFTWLPGDTRFPMSSCITCQRKSFFGPTCTAFPGGIPEPILSGEHRHTTPYIGDGGLQYLQAPRDEDWLRREEAGGRRPAKPRPGTSRASGESGRGGGGRRGGRTPPS
jgi:hypothetical protein